MRAWSRWALVVVAVLLGAGGRSASAGPWGNDVNAGDGARLVESVRAELAAIVATPAAARAQAIESSVPRAVEAMEAVKRFRNDELRPLFHRLLTHEDWKVVHRALLALERYGDATVLPRALALLEHPEPRLREKAAIACIRLGEPAAWKAAGVADPAAAVAARRRREPDPHVRACLDALGRRLGKSLPVRRVSEEVRVPLEGGLLWTPFLEGMDKAKSVAPSYTSKPDSRMGGGSAEKLPVASRFVLPLLGFGAEEVPGVSLQPFGNPRNNGAVYHTGLDVGACLDGAGFYAVADGIVKMVHTGSDMGTLVCIEHHVGPKALATVFFMHAADVVFVEPGERVAPGQLVASMGLGYSFENGGHFAHLHLGAYPGPFQPAHNYGYKPANLGLRDWFDPAVVIPAWVERTRPPVDEPGAVDPSLDDAVADLRAGRYREALEAARGVAARSSGDAASTDAARLESLLTGAGAALVERATAICAGGFPLAARALLAAWAPALAGVPGGDAAKQTLAAWDADPAFQRDRKAEEGYDDALEREKTMLAKHEPAAKVAAMWSKLAEQHAGTSVEPRLKAKAAENAPR
ncbi:MAG: HEAT repeat domain-containing protein [Planctomycetes bacterium]|nr:HEAT repeat domain-containing protein [Planctomycetota bacterium]